MGTITPFSHTTLETLYGSHDGYVDKFNESTQELWKDDWITKADRQTMKLSAAKSDVLK